MELTHSKEELALISEIVIQKYSKLAILDAMKYFSTDDTKELAGMFVQSDTGVMFKPFDTSGNVRAIELNTSDYKTYLENNTLLGLAHSHPNNETLEPSRQDLMQSKFSIHDFFIFKPHNFNEFTFIGTHNDYCKKFRLVGVTARLNL